MLSPGSRRRSARTTVRPPMPESNTPIGADGSGPGRACFLFLATRGRSVRLWCVEPRELDYAAADSLGQTRAMVGLAEKLLLALVAQEPALDQHRRHEIVPQHVEVRLPHAAVLYPRVGNRLLLDLCRQLRRLDQVLVLGQVGQYQSD